MKHSIKMYINIFQLSAFREEENKQLSLSFCLFINALVSFCLFSYVVHVLHFPLEGSRTH